MSSKCLLFYFIFCLAVGRSGVRKCVMNVTLFSFASSPLALKRMRASVQYITLPMISIPVRLHPPFISVEFLVVVLIIKAQ